MNASVGVDCRGEDGGTKVVEGRRPRAPKQGERRPRVVIQLLLLLEKMTK